MRIYILSLLILSTLISSAQQFHLFIGTYTNTGSKGIYVYRFDAATGQVSFVSSTDSVVNPSFIALAPNGRNVYAVNETNGTNPGKVSAFSFDKQTGKLTLINQQISGGDDPCHLTVDKNNNWILVGNYSGGSVAALAINGDGSINPPVQVVQHSGASINKQRQEKAHVHQAVFSPNYDYLFTPDLGTDKLMVYKFLPKRLKPLVAATPPSVSITGGSGPRHFAFHPNKKFAYLVGEMTGTIDVFKYSKGKLTKIQRVLAHPASFKGFISSADIHLSSDGKYLYSSNRGDENNIAIFSVSEKTGKLKVKAYQPTLGKTPRNFMIDPTGNYLLVANQDTDNIVIFKRNKETGLLVETGDQIQVPRPVCLQMLH